MSIKHEIANRLYELAREHHKAFVLLDRFAEAPLRDAMDGSNMRNAPACLPLIDKMFDEEPQRSPALLALDLHQPGHMDMLDRSATLAIAEAASPDRVRSVCGWLFCQGDPRQLQYALSRRLRAVDDEGRPVYLRYFDPRCCHDWWHFLATWPAAR